MSDPSGGDPSAGGSPPGSDPSASGPSPVPDGIIVPIQALVGQAAAEGVFTGIMVLMASQAMYSVAERGLRGSMPRILTFSALLAMLTSSLLTFSVDIAICLFVLTEIGPNPAPGRLLSQLVVISRIFTRLNFIVGDLIVASRAWILAKNLIIRACLATTILITIGCYLAESVLVGKDSFNQPDGNEVPAHFLIQGIPLLFTNALSTAIIAYTTWSYRSQIKVHLQTQTRKTQVEKVLFLLLESGLIYCAVWILEILLNADIGLDPIAEQIIGAIIPYLATIYPTAIILLVERNKIDDPLPGGGVESSMKFAAGNAPPTHVSIVQSIADHLAMEEIWNLTPDDSTQADDSRKASNSGLADTGKAEHKTV